jgi:hypothetical protein
MVVAFDAKSLSPVGVAWAALTHSRSWGHTGTGSDLCAEVDVLVRRNEAVDPAVAVTYGDRQMVSKGRVWLNNLPPSHRTHSFIETFTLTGVVAGAKDVKVTVSSGTRFSGEYRAVCRTFTGVAKIGSFTTVFGDDDDDSMSITVGSKSGRVVSAVFAHEATQPVTAFSGTSRYPLDLFLSISEGVVGDTAGAPTVVLSAERGAGRAWCGCAIDLIAAEATSLAAQLSITGGTPKIRVVPPPPVSSVTIPVLTLAPAFNQMNPNHLRGELFRFPYIPTKIPYINLPFEGFANGGMNKLDTYLHKWVGTRILVVGHSEGAQVIYKWLRELGATSDIDPTEVTYICTGNLERLYNGFPGGGDYPGGVDGTGLPDGAHGYRVIDIARQYDFWADHPTDTDNVVAMRNVDPQGNGLGGGSPVHSDYSLVSANPDDARNFSLTEDTVTYVVSPTYPAPLIDDADFFATTTTLIPRDDVVRAEIELAYTRPVTVPDPPPGGAVDPAFPWGWDGTQWIRVSRASVDAPSPITWWLE